MGNAGGGASGPWFETRGFAALLTMRCVTCPRPHPEEPAEGGKAEGWATQEAATPDARCCGRVCAVGTARRAALTGPGGLPCKAPTFKTRRPRKLGILLVSRDRVAFACGSTRAPPGQRCTDTWS